MAGRRYLIADDVVALVEYFFRRAGYAPPIFRDQGRALLESAVNRARAAAYDAELDLAAQAAALIIGVALNRPLVDGNRLAAWIACTAFLSVNQRPLPRDALVALARKIVESHEASDRRRAEEILAAWLRAKLESG